MLPNWQPASMPQPVRRVMSEGEVVEQLIEYMSLVLLGVSRTSKTPTCIYLAHRGIRRFEADLAFHRQREAREEGHGSTATRTRLPSASVSCPRTTTSSPARRPARTSISSPLATPSTSSATRRCWLCEKPAASTCASR